MITVATIRQWFTEEAANSVRSLSPYSVRPLPRARGRVGEGVSLHESCCVAPPRPPPPRGGGGAGGGGVASSSTPLPGVLQRRWGWVAAGEERESEPSKYNH